MTLLVKNDTRALARLIVRSLRYGGFLTRRLALQPV